MATKETKTIHQRMSELRKETLTQDWEDDKCYFVGSVLKFKYLSADKMKRNLAPLFAKYGLEVRTRYHDLQNWPAIGQMSQHWTIQLDVTLVDVATGETETSTVYGEAADSGDKGINKAQTDALKQWAFNTLFITDDILDSEGGVVRNATGSYTPKSAEEEQEAKSAILAHSVRPVAPAEPAEPAKAPEKKTEAPAKADAAPKTPEEQKAIERGREVVEQAKAEAPAEPVALAKPIMNVMDNIVSKWTAAAKEGKIPAWKFNEMSASRADVRSAKDASAFIRKYQEVPVGGSVA